MIEATVTGIEDVKQRLKTLAGPGANRAVGKGIRAGLKVIEREQIARAPVGPSGRKNAKGEAITPGGLKRSISSRFRRRTRRGQTQAVSGLNVKKKAGSSLRAYHAHLVALGTGPRWQGVEYIYSKRKKGQRQQYVDQKFSHKFLFGNAQVRYVGEMPANPFIREAAAAAEGRAIAETRQATLAGIDAEVRRIGR